MFHSKHIYINILPIMLFICLYKWLENVDADMAELEIDKEDVHDRSKWRRNVNVEEEVQPYRKTDYKPIIYISSVYGLFTNRVGLRLHNIPSPGVLMKSIGAEFSQLRCPSRRQTQAWDAISNSSKYYSLARTELIPIQNSNIDDAINRPLVTSYHIPG